MFNWAVHSCLSLVLRDQPIAPAHMTRDVKQWRKNPQAQKGKHGDPGYRVSSDCAMPQPILEWIGTASMRKFDPI